MRYRPMAWFGESGPIRRAVAPYLARRMNERQAYCRIEWLPSVADKVTRCRSFQAMAAMGKIMVLAEAPWRSELLGQLARFPAGRFDDGVDVCSLLGRGLEMLPAALQPGPAQRAQYTPLYDPFAECWRSISGAGRHAYEYDPYSTARPRFSAEQQADALTLDEGLRRRAQQGRS